MGGRMASGLRKWAFFGLSCFVVQGTTLQSAPARALDNRDKSEAPALPRGGHAPRRDDWIDREIETLRNGIKVKQTDAAYIRLGYLLCKKGAFDDAVRVFDEALKLNPHAREAKTGKGIALCWKGEFEGAEEVLRDALVLNPDPAKVHYGLGLVYQKRGDSGKAIAEYKEGLKRF